MSVTTITDLTELKAVENDMAGDYELANNIDGDSAAFEPIGFGDEYPFSGTFDGQGHTIKGLIIDESEQNVGLFSWAYAVAILQKLTVDNSVTGTRYVGGITGRYGTFTKCRNLGTINGSSSYVGGITGRGGTFTECANLGNIISSSQRVGGLSGTGSEFNDCYNAGDVTGTNFVAGIAGTMQGDINRCYNVGTIADVTYKGGITGWVAIGTASNCYSQDIETIPGADDALSESDMKNQDTYEPEWDFTNTWIMDGYPELREFYEETAKPFLIAKV